MNFDPNSATGLVQVGMQIKTPYNPDHKNFGPRVGLAWDVTGKGTIILHAGASVMTDDGIPMFLFVGQGGEQGADARRRTRRQGILCLELGETARFNWA